MAQVNRSTRTAATRRTARPDARTRYYVDGNTVRKLAPAPYEREYEEQERLRRERLRRREAARAREQEINRQIARENQARILRIDRRYMVFLGLAVAATLLICVYYLSLQSQVSVQSHRIAVLKSEVNTLIDENLAAKERISNAVDLDEVYDRAINEMGMHYPGKRQIVSYAGAGEDYVKQYRDIPELK